MLFQKDLDVEKGSTKESHACIILVQALIFMTQQQEFAAVRERQESSFAAKALVNVSTPPFLGQDGKPGFL